VNAADIDTAQAGMAAGAEPDAVTGGPITGGTVTSDSPLDALPTTRRAILNLIKREGPLGAAAVAKALVLTPAAIRMQLVRLEQDGLLERVEDGETGRRGRPTHTYRLSAAAEALYPKRYGDLTTELLSYLGGPDGAQVDQLFEQRRRRRVDGAKPRLAHLSFDEQVSALAAILDEDGYLADALRQDDGSWLVTEHNCAILTVARGFGQACSSELAFIRDALPGATVERVAHLMDGAHVCAYRISPPETRPAR
jgi:DeoR family suf operon transcriptional repressor